MTKKEISKMVLQDGVPLNIKKFKWNKKTKTFSSLENGLILNFIELEDCTFETESLCTFKTGSFCTFETESLCTFKTGSFCTFETGSNCVCIRRDIFCFFQIPENTDIILDENEIEGFKVL